MRELKVFDNDVERVIAYGGKIKIDLNWGFGDITNIRFTKEELEEMLEMLGN